MCCIAFFGNLIHALRSNLDFNPFPTWSHDSDVQRFVSSSFGIGNPISQTKRIGIVMFSNNGINFPSIKFFILFIRFVNNSNGKFVIDFLKANVLCTHFSAYRVDGFGPPFDGVFKVLIFERFSNFFRKSFDVSVLLFFAFDNLSRNIIVHIRFGVFQAQVF